MEDYGEDWDLAAIVRSCFCFPTSTYTERRDEIAAYSPLVVSGENDSINGGRTDQVKGEDIFFGFSTEIFERKSRSFEGEAEGGLEVLCSPFLSNNAAADAADSRVERVAAAPSQNTAPRAKRRKKQLKKVVCQVPADGVSSDVWSWRKYGQKAIKGSPFPRGYYRCSTIRGCPARKQVERDRSKPGQLIISYTSEHNHPVPAHHKFPSTAPSKRRGEQSIPTSPATSVSMDNDEQEKEQEEETLMVEDMELIGEDELIFMEGNPTETLFDDDDGLFADRIFASPWLEKSSSNNATAAAC